MQIAEFKMTDIVVYKGVICLYSTIRPHLDEQDLEKVKLASPEDIKKYRNANS